ncbi:hypothetical protein ACLOJK_003541 [Asimina triloba]
MRMRIKQRKSSAFPCNAGGRCSLSAVVWSLVGCILMIHFYSLARHHEREEIQMRVNRFPLTRELEEIEEENFQLQPKGKRSPRAAKRRGNKKPSLIDEFLDDSSQIRLLFFPDRKTAFGPTKSTANESMHYHPGRLWLDTDGNAIQAHGGGILYDVRTETYYWYGENKDGPTYQAHKKGTARFLPRPHAPLGKQIHNLDHESGSCITLVIMRGMLSCITHQLCACFAHMANPGTHFFAASTSWPSLSRMV